MAPITISIKGWDDQGYETTFSTTVEELDEKGTAEYHFLQTCVGIAKIEPNPKGGVPAPAPSGGQTGGGFSPDLACQFCANEVKPVEKFGNMKRDMSASEVAASRAEKMGKMGKTAKPVCSKCWSQGGHAKAWDEYYKSQRR